MRIFLPLFATALLCAQTFEVASVKVNQSNDGGYPYPGLVKGKFSGHNIPMRLLLEVAWGLNSAQIVGPAWIDSDHFDVEARAPDGVPDTDVQPMMQALLKDRFGLVAHTETKDMAVYNLVVAKGGPKMKPFDPEHPMMPPARMPGAQGILIGNMTMEQLAARLSGAVGRPVIDKTALEARYTFAVQFGSANASGSDSVPDIFGAVRELGLNLESARGSITKLIVDHANRTPTSN